MGLSLAFTPSVQANGVTIQSYGHSSLFIKGGGHSILLNPFKAVGCAKGLEEPRINAEIILASSLLADEGSRIAKGEFLINPGSYRINGLNIDGFSGPHDRLGGRRFGQSTLWRWQQADLNFAHLGGTVAPLTGEGKVLLGRPDVLIIGIGGGAKVYNGKEAAKIVEALNPHNVIPVQYLNADSPPECNLSGIEEFLDAMNDIKVQRVGNIFRLSKNTKGEMTITIMNAKQKEPIKSTN